MRQAPGKPCAHLITGIVGHVYNGVWCRATKMCPSKRRIALSAWVLDKITPGPVSQPAGHPTDALGASNKERIMSTPNQNEIDIDSIIERLLEVFLCTSYPFRVVPMQN